MSQTDADQKNTAAAIDELAAAMGRPLTDIEKLSVTAAMYQHQRDDLLAVAEKIARWACTNEIKEGGGFDFFAEELVPELFTAIASARGEK